MIEAKYYRQLGNGKVDCFLCPHMCKLDEGDTGICKVRVNMKGKLYLTNYGMLTAVNIDPIEKKPLYHFFPGKEILSLGNNGCNMRCKCCQNWEISQSSTKKYHNFKSLEIDEIIEIAKTRKRNIGVAYTYNEPVIWIEYLLEIAKQINRAGLKNVMVSNGYINKEALFDLMENMDAFNIDIKAFTDEKYREIAKASLEPVKNTIKQIVSSGRHLELTHLVIPGFNDNENEFMEMINWISGELGDRIILHLTRYFPAYKMTEQATSPSTLTRFGELAREKLKYVYLGNINIYDGQDTYCGNCNTKVISRKGYSTNILAVDGRGNCNHCGSPVIIC